jgi:hypothetical protein
VLFLFQGCRNAIVRAVFDSEHKPACSRFQMRRQGLEEIGSTATTAPASLDRYIRWHLSWQGAPQIPLCIFPIAGLPICDNPTRRRLQLLQGQPAGTSSRVPIRFAKAYADDPMTPSMATPLASGYTDDAMSMLLPTSTWSKSNALSARATVVDPATIALAGHSRCPPGVRLKQLELPARDFRGKIQVVQA